MMSIANDPSKYRKRTALGRKTAAKIGIGIDPGMRRGAVVRALAAAGPRSYMNLRGLNKKPSRG
jgi:hypothetical protein